MGKNTLGISVLLPLLLTPHLLAQSTNFTPVQMSMETNEHGLIVRFNSDAGRIYQLQETSTLTNWTVVQQLVGDYTNMFFFIPMERSTEQSTNVGGIVGPPPVPGLMSASAIGVPSLPPAPLLPPSPPGFVYSEFGALVFAPEEYELLSLSLPVNTAEPSSGTNPAAEAKFFRVVCPEDRIQFPDWIDHVDQFMYFDVWTSIQGTYNLELFTNGVLYWSSSRAVPPDGYFSVWDPGYDPGQWPFTGDYPFSEWKLRVTVTPASFAEGETATATVTKIQHRRDWNARIGMVANQEARSFFGQASVTVVDEFEQFFMGHVVQSCNLAGHQVKLDGSNKDWQQFAEELLTTTDWMQLKDLMFGKNPAATITDLHYFGHGSATGIGPYANNLVKSIDLGQIQADPHLKTNKMWYVALDGCNTAKNKDLLYSLLGVKEAYTAVQMTERGMNPNVGWGWSDKKRAKYLDNSGLLYYPHFNFIADFYTALSHVDDAQYFDNTFQQAINFAKFPNGLGNDPTVITNSEGNSMVIVGCKSCYFDEMMANDD